MEASEVPSPDQTSVELSPTSLLDSCAAMPCGLPAGLCRGVWPYAAVRGGWKLCMFAKRARVCTCTSCKKKDCSPYLLISTPIYCGAPTISPLVSTRSYYRTI